jgi:formate hydrogenlyase subunit 6/NADH:ubiquinone oxidoreductase subunit I
MPGSPAAAAPQSTLERQDLDRLFQFLRARGYTVMGPVPRDGAIVWDEVSAVGELPAGWTDEQEAGRYRLTPSAGPALFDWTVGPASPKAALLPATFTLLNARREGSGLQLLDGDPRAAKLAFFGLRACELAAIAVQDRVLLGGAVTDPVYRARREDALLIAVQCGRAGHTCFCASLGTGPEVRSGHDLVLTEVIEGGRHVFVAGAGSERGAALLAGLGAPAAGATETGAARQAVARAAAGMGRTLETDGLAELLADQREHPRWDVVAARCLACGNCTSVCPTCFCVTTEDFTDLAAGLSRRVRRWDSCFSVDFTYIHGGNVRSSIRARYRHWLTHKLGAWHEQFGSSGCVGCGRCITWCPAGIDITEEARALRQHRHGKEAARGNA